MVACAVITTLALSVMVAIAAESVEALLALGVSLAGLSAIALRPSRAGRQRRRLRQRVGDPAALQGEWRRLLAAAWQARDDFARAAAELGSSPLQERVAGHQYAVDGALERCGSLARSGQQLSGQLRAFRARRLRRDLFLERGRDAAGPRAAALADQLRDVECLQNELRALRVRLESQVHQLRAAAWRVATLRSSDPDERDEALTELLVDLDHLRSALVEVAADGPATYRILRKSGSPAGA